MNPLNMEILKLEDRFLYLNPRLHEVKWDLDPQLIWGTPLLIPCILGPDNELVSSFYEMDESGSGRIFSIRYTYSYRPDHTLLFNFYHLKVGIRFTNFVNKNPNVYIDITDGQGYLVSWTRAIPDEYGDLNNLRLKLRSLFEDEIPSLILEKLL